MKPLCQAGRIDLWLPCFYLCKTVFSFFSHESTATGFLDCSSVGPLGSSLLHMPRFLCLPLGFLSSALLERSAWGGKGRGVGWRLHIQGCTLMITVVFPSKGLFFVVVILFSCVFLISQLKQPYPLPLQSSGRSNFVYIKLVFVSTNLSEALCDSVVFNLKKCH